MTAPAVDAHSDLRVLSLFCEEEAMGSWVEHRPGSKWRVTEGTDRMECYADLGVAARSAGPYVVLLFAAISSAVCTVSTCTARTVQTDSLRFPSFCRDWLWLVETGADMLEK